MTNALRPDLLKTTMPSSARECNGRAMEAGGDDRGAPQVNASAQAETSIQRASQALQQGRPVHDDI